MQEVIVSASHAFTFVDPQGRKEKGTRRRNPDGSLGGWVASSAKVHASAVIHPEAIVEPKAVVDANVVVDKGSVVVARTKA